MIEKKRQIRLSVTSCPECKEIGGLKRILFGMPDDDFDHDRYIVGGCIVSDADPEVGCVKCK